MRRFFMLAAGLWAGLWLGGPQARASTVSDSGASAPQTRTGADMPEPMFGSPPLDDAELAEARGGFRLGSGVEIDFGAVITTSVDGATLLQTQLRMNGDGVTSTVSGAPGVTVTVDGAQTTASAQLTDLLVRQAVGQRISSIIVNTGDNRVIDNQVSINLRLDGVQPLTVGGGAYQIQAMTLDAAMLRMR